MNVIFAWRLKLQILTWSERHVAKSKSSSETCVQFTFTINAIAMVHANVNATLQLAFDVIKKTRRNDMFDNYTRSPTVSWHNL